MINKQEQLKFCKICHNRSFDINIGIVCSLTNKSPDFINTCNHFSKNEKLVISELEKQRKTIELNKETNFYQEKIRPFLGIAALIMLGFIMLKEPYIMENVDIEGRKTFLKGILKLVWSRPLGAISLLAGISILYIHIKSFKNNSK